MDKINELAQRKWVVIGAAAVAGLLLGLLYAWVINPVQWVNGTPENLRSDYQTDYMKAAIDSYSINRDVDLAVARYASLGAAAPAILAGIQADPDEVSPAAVDDYAATVNLYTGEPTATPASGTARPTPSTAQYLLPVCGVTLVLGLLLAGVVLIRGRTGRRADRSQPELGYEEPPNRAGNRAPAPAASRRRRRPSGLDRPPLATFRPRTPWGRRTTTLQHRGANGDFLGSAASGSATLSGLANRRRSRPSKCGCSTRTIFRQSRKCS
jgi:hypothetical protein